MITLYRIYQLFRTFWVQNTLACLVGGLICFLFMGLAQFSLVFFEHTRGYLNSTTLQILPQQDIAINAQATQVLLNTLTSQLPEMELSIHQDTQLTLEGLSVVGADQWLAHQEGLLVPDRFILGKFKTSPGSQFQKRLDEVSQVAGVARVDADLNLFELIQQLNWIAPVTLGGMGLLLLILLFYLIQFVVSQLMIVRVEELCLEYLLGASTVYQKLPYWGFILLIGGVSLGVAGLLWGVLIHPQWAAIQGWLQRLGLETPSPVVALNVFQSQAPLLFLGLWVGVVSMVGVAFEGIWRVQFRRLMQQDMSKT